MTRSKAIIYALLWGLIGGSGSVLDAADCNGNGVPDPTDIATGTSEDCNANGVPDECDVAAEFSFESTVSFSIGAGAINAIDVVAADLDGDGALDLATANRGSGNVSVLLNKGDRTFSQFRTFPVGSGSWLMAGQDLDGDSDADLVTIDRDSETVSILLNKGDATFASAVMHSPGFEPWALAVSDLDGDDAPDIAVAGGEANLRILWNKGDGTFPTTKDIAIPRRPNAMAAVDLDGDGDADLAIGCNSGSPYTVAVLKNNGGRTFAAPVSITHAFIPGFLAAEDLDGDGDGDLVVADKRTVCQDICDEWGWCWTDCKTTGDSVSVLLNTGTGTFAMAKKYTVVAMPNGIAASDFDGDGDADLVTTSEIGSTVSVLLNEGDGTFASAVTLPAGGRAFRVAAADLDGDGSTDIVTANGNSNNVGVIFTRRVSGSRDVNHNSIPDECEAARFKRGDSNVDGAIDIADAISTLAYLFSGGPCSCPKSADVNDSGRLDIADAIYLLSYIFASGPAPAAPWEACGLDPTGDELACESFGPCQ